MSIVSSDLVAYNALNQPVDDASAAGGGIDAKSRVVFTQLTATAKVTFQSTDAGDTGNVTITGRDATGRVISEVLVMGGAAETASVNSYARLHSVRMAGDAIGTVTVRQGMGGSTITTIPAGERGFAALFQQSSSGVAPVTRYDKLFFKNATGTGLTLFAPTVSLALDATGDYEIGLAAAVNDAVAIADRVSAPAGISFVGLNDPVDVPGGVLDAGDAIGVWVKQTLAANEGAHNTSITGVLSGQTV